MLKYPIKHYFTYHAPKPGQRERYNAIAIAAENLAEIIEVNAPDSAERTRAFRAVMDARLLANQAIAINE